MRDYSLIVRLRTAELGGYEGPLWLAEVLDAAARAPLEIVRLDDALEGLEPADPLRGRPAGATTWGTPRDLSTWSGPQVADLAWRVRDAELRVVAAGARAPVRAVRELLALQSSDWAFLATRGGAGPYPRERAAGHGAALDAALAGGGGASEPALRNLAAHLTPAAGAEP